MNRLLHVANGTSTTASIAEAGIAGRLSIWADPLHEGPVPGHLPDEDLLAVRARHVAGDELSVDEVAAAFRQWRSVLDEHAAYDELILWFEHDLFDQLNLIQVLSRIGPSWPKPVTLICIGSYPGRPHFKGLGELSPAELAPLFGTRREVTPEQYALADRAWQAFTSPSPADLDALQSDDTSALPFLSAALARHLEEFPWTNDGLSRTERRLMQLAQVGTLALHAAFARMHDLETAFYIADSSLLHVAQELAAGPSPLVTLRRSPGSTGGTLDVGVTLTDAGRAVLDGRADRVRRCGIDRWLGGVHLTGEGPLWRWDPAEAGVTEG